jgi:hypothetical protein
MMGGWVMDPFNSETWKQQWAAFWSAPAIIGPLLLIVASAVWWFRGRLFEAHVYGLKEQIAAVEQRLKLATDLVAAADRARDELDRQFQAYKVDVAAKGSNASPAMVEAAFEQLNKEDALVTHALQVVRDAVGMGVTRRLSIPVGSGYPADKVPGLTLTSIHDDIKKRD